MLSPEHRQRRLITIAKTCLYKFDPLKTPPLTSKTGVYRGIHYFSYFGSKTSIVGTIEAVLTSTHNLCFEQKYEKYLSFLSENFQFFWR